MKAIEIKRLPKLAQNMDEQCQEFLKTVLSGVGPVQETCQFVADHKGDHITSKGRRWKNRFGD
jgi:hypothetical protein